MVKHKTAFTSNILTPQIRFERGYNDGQAARERNRLPLWAANKSHAYRPKHPFDAKYGEGFWAGWESLS
jgi:hypothetical protein